MEVDDKLYDRLVKQHKDLPESIIEILADNKHRNNFIVNSYVSKKDTYGKTIIFADRWFQCEHIKNKLVEKGIKADAIYSHIDADPGSADARNKRKEDDNKRILDNFKSDKLDVLINVRMLTEGVDVPNLQTVFITRQTTSSILMTQMIGRALRGKKAGGSSEANVILFFDDWKRLIDWVDPIDGGTKPDPVKPDKGENYPLEYISIRLIEELSKSIENDGVYPIEYKKIFPVGWYKTEIVYADSDNNNDSMEPFTEFVMVYEHTQSKFEAFISSITDPKLLKLLDEWSKEYLDDEWMQPKVKEWIDKYFDDETDDIGRTKTKLPIPKTDLSIPKNLDLSFTLESEKAIRTITRIVNFFYHCKAVYKVDWEVYTYTYNIYLYPNNKPEWLLEHKAELLKFVQDKLGRRAYNIEVTTKK